MDFVHSFWSKPSLNYRWCINNKNAIISNIWYYSLSVAYLKRLKQNIVLYTDSFGNECLNHIPYDKIYLTLEEKIDKNTPPIMWACGKFYALNEEPLSSVHIDGDVFIKEEKCLEIITGEKYDLLVQNEEYTNNSGIYIKENKRIQHLDYPFYLDRIYGKSYNTGIIRFSNNDLKKKFLDNYFYFNEQIIHDNVIKKMWDLDRNISPDIVVEQLFLHQLSHNFKTICLVDFIDYQSYQHVIGKKKYQYLDNCKATLKFINEDLYHLTEEKEKYLKEKYFSDNIVIV